MTSIDEIEDDFWKRGERVLRSTVPIYRPDERGRLELFATGVLLAIGSKRFLIGAAHALVELRQHPVWIGGDRHAVRIEGQFFHSGAIGQVDFDNDAFDVGFVPLSASQVAGLGESIFISERDLTGSEGTLTGTFHVVGFIASDYRPTTGETLTAKATTLAARAAASNSYDLPGVSDASHVLLNFDRLKTYAGGEQQATPKLHGMSGSGVWRAVGDRDELVAVLIEHHQRDRMIIVATRVHVLSDAIRRSLADTAREDG